MASLLSIRQLLHFILRLISRLSRSAKTLVTWLAHPHSSFRHLFPNSSDATNTSRGHNVSGGIDDVVDPHNVVPSPSPAAGASTIISESRDRGSIAFPSARVEDVDLDDLRTAEEGTSLRLGGPSRDVESGEAFQDLDMTKGSSEDTADPSVGICSAMALYFGRSEPKLIV